MPRYIYRKANDQNIYDASTNQRISATDFGNGAGFTELKAIDGAKYGTKELQTANFDNITPIGNTLYGIQKQAQVAPAPVVNNSTPSNQLGASTIATGLSAGNVASSLPSANVQAQQIYTQNLLNDSQTNVQNLQNQYNNIQATQLKETSANLKQAQDDYAKIQTNKQTEATNYDSAVTPIVDKVKAQYSSMLDSLNQYDYNNLVKQKIDLTNNIIEYAKMMNDDLNANAASPSLASIMQGRSDTIKNNYTSKIATAQAAMSAIDGNFTLASDIMDKAVSSINQTMTNRVSFLQSINTLYEKQESNAKSKVDTLTTDQKTQFEKAVTELKGKIDTIQKNKETIIKLMEENPVVANKAGLSLTDTQEQIASKLQNFYIKNPQYTAENQAFIKKAMEKYFDAGITLNDPLETVKSKLMMSKIYEKDTSGKFTFSTNPVTGETIVQDTTNGTVSSVNANIPANGSTGGQCGDYVHTIMNNAPAVGDTWQSKQKAMNTSPADFASSPQVGDIVTFKTNSSTGHVAVVTAVNGSQATITESNWNLDGKVGTRTIDVNNPNILGAYRGASFKETSKNNAGDETVDTYVNLLNKGQIKVSEIPAGIRNKVIAKVGQTDGSINKPLSEPAITAIEQSKSALSSLDVLEQKIKDNLQYIGPITGFQTLNPWSKARQVQADIDRVRQTVGKALEGGVLRKEDEEKYKKILANINDTPENAVYKITALKASLQNNIDSYIKTQQSSGHYVDDSVKPTNDNSSGRWQGSNGASGRWQSSNK